MTDPSGPWPRPDAPATPPGAPSALVAFVDESMRRTQVATVEYLMAATVVSTGECDEVRRALTALVPGKRGKLHWRDESSSRRELVAKTIRSTGARSLVVVGQMADPRKQERARRLVLGQLLHILDRRQVSHVVLESRHPERDRHDIEAVGAFRNQRMISRRLAVSHGKPLQEPMLWIPDAVAGATGDGRCGHSVCFEVLRELIDVLEAGTV
jgi:hypothetical protein